MSACDRYSLRCSQRTLQLTSICIRLVFPCPRACSTSRRAAAPACCGPAAGSWSGRCCSPRWASCRAAPSSAWSCGCGRPVACPTTLTSGRTRCTRWAASSSSHIGASFTFTGVREISASGCSEVVGVAALLPCDQRSQAPNWIRDYHPHASRIPLHVSLHELCRSFVLPACSPPGHASVVEPQAGSR